MKEVSTSSWQATNIASTEILSDLGCGVRHERAQLAAWNPNSFHTNTQTSYIFQGWSLLGMILLMPKWKKIFRTHSISIWFRISSISISFSRSNQPRRMTNTAAISTKETSRIKPYLWASNTQGLPMNLISRND